ncbi:hypothetical protein ARMGADRAFT_1035935 [Armillaria gallica]|uniref:Uncharacterized protein n=1 Tax=Armillaria gallica TaxID=47427 RepID=A0A2H3DCG6_ARMGA|nr:hypothetical protein ARMGADRAFT_1035935 [Armillaria gallica]
MCGCENSKNLGSRKPKQGSSWIFKQMIYFTGILKTCIKHLSFIAFVQASPTCYTLHSTNKGTPNDVKCWKRDMEGIVSTLAECLKKKKGSHNDINQFQPSYWGLETKNGSEWLSDPNMDIELGYMT